MEKTVLSVITVIVCALVASLPLFHKGLFPTHDGEYHVVRFYEFDKVLREGSLYPRFAPDLLLGYGVPLFNYVYPFPNYAASFFHFFGASFIDSFKLSLAAGLIMSSIFFYLWARIFWGEEGGLLSSVLYTYAPYHFVDIYVRGSVGEVWGLAFFPGFLWAVTRYSNTADRKYFLLAVLLLSLVVFSHNILGLLFFVFALFYSAFLLFFSPRQWYFLKRIPFVFLLSLSLSAIFWMPALIEQSYVLGLQVFSVDTQFPELYELIFPSWGTGFSSSSASQRMSFQIGIAQILSVLCAFFLFLYALKKKDKRKQILLFFILTFLASFVFMLKLSLPLWQAIPFFDYFQFPWRLLSLSILSASLLGGSLMAFSKIFVSRKTSLSLLCGVGILLVVLLTIGYTRPAYYHMRDDSYYITRKNFIHGTNSPGNTFTTIWFKERNSKKIQRVSVARGEAKITQITERSESVSFSLDAKKPSTVILAKTYFPQWIGYVDGSIINARPSATGLTQITLPQGRHRVFVTLSDTAVRKAATLLFFISLFALFWVYTMKSDKKALV